MRKYTKRTVTPEPKKVATASTAFEKSMTRLGVVEFRTMLASSTLPARCQIELMEGFKALKGEA